MDDFGVRRQNHTTALGGILLCLLTLPILAVEPFTVSSNENRPSRVVTIQDPEATAAFSPNPDRIASMVERGIVAVTGKSTSAAAWLSLVNSSDVIGLKVYSTPGPNSGTRPVVAAAVVHSLVAAGIPAGQIIIWDKSEVDLQDAGFANLAARLGVRIAGSASAGYDPTNFYDTPLIGNLVWGDFEFGKTGEGIGRKSFVSKLVSQQLTKIINLTPLLNHNLAGVSGNLYGLAVGSVDNTLRFENDPTRIAKAVPEIYAMASIGDKVVLNITDALICQYEGGQRGLLHYSVVLNQLRFSRDPVALDVLSLRELDRQRRASRAPYVKPNFELYANANLLELGMNEFSRIQVENLK